jgi:hypothetical protein
MTAIDLFYQGEGLREIEHIEVEPDATFATIKTRLREKHGFAIETFLFIEDDDEPVEEAVCVAERAGQTGLKAHLHRCHHIDVTVTFNGETVGHHFSPATTVARVKRWAAEHKFGMTPEEAGEHVLQIAGTHTRPSPGTHIGALVEGCFCKLAFDLVPDHRVNGAPEQAL